MLEKDRLVDYEIRNRTKDKYYYSAPKPNLNLENCTIIIGFYVIMIHLMLINTSFILLLIKLLLCLKIGDCARYNVVGSQDQQQV